MTASFESTNSSNASDLTVRQQRIVDALRLFFGPEAEALYEISGRSLHKLTHYARQSTLPECHRLVIGLALAQELLLEELTSRPVFETPVAVSNFLKLHFAGQPHESFGVLFLDAKHALITFEEMFRGTLTQTHVYPREIVLRSLHHQAAAVVLTHNHPSGGVEPSRADEALTKTLKSALMLVDVRVLDHIIVSGSTSLSMAERGLI
jgi:DNA repair protein RadC